MENYGNIWVGAQAQKPRGLLLGLTNWTSPSQIITYYCISTALKLICQMKNDAITVISMKRANKLIMPVETYLIFCYFNSYSNPRSLYSTLIIIPNSLNKVYF